MSSRAYFNVVRPTAADGHDIGLQANSRGDLATQEQYAPDYEDNTNDVAWMQARALASSTGAWTPYQSGTSLIGTAGLVIKASAGRLRRIGGSNTSGSINYWLVLVDKASAPATNDAVVAAAFLPHTAASRDAGPLDLGVDGKYFTNGIAFAISTTPHIVTLGTAVCHVWGDFL